MGWGVALHGGVADRIGGGRGPGQEDVEVLQELEPLEELEVRDDVGVGIARRGWRSLRGRGRGRRRGEQGRGGGERGEGVHGVTTFTPRMNFRATPCPWKKSPSARTSASARKEIHRQGDQETFRSTSGP